MSNRLYLADKGTLDAVKRTTDLIAYNLGIYKLKSWAEVQSIVRAGEAHMYMSVGDEIISLYDGNAITWVVIGIDVDTPTNSSYTHSLTLQTKDCLMSVVSDAKEPSNPNSDRQNYGNNRYIHSAVRQWLNSDASSFVWQSQHQYDAAPTSAPYTGAGFLHRLDPELVAVLGAVNKKVARNTVTDGGGQDTFSDRVFLLSRLEVDLGTEGATAGEFIYPYYQGIGDASRIKRLGGSSSVWWLRSPNVSYSCYVRDVDTSGAIDNYHAHNSFGLAPACAII